MPRRFDDRRQLEPGDAYFLEAPDFPVLHAFPANKHGDTQPFESLGPRILQRQADSLYLAATGDDLDATATITTGHAHATWSSHLWWQQIGSWRPGGDKDTSAREAFFVVSDSAVDVLYVPFRIPLAADGLSAPIVRVVPRVRLSIPAPGSVTHTTLTVNGTFYRVNSSAFTSVATMAPLALTSVSGGPSWSDTWVEGAAVDFAAADLVTAGGVLWWALSAKVAVALDEAALWEFQLGYLEG